MDVQPRIDALLSRQQVPLIEGMLLLNEVLICQPHSTANAGINSTFYVFLDGGAEAFHKPFAGVVVNTASLYDQHPDAVPINECAAWRLASALGGPVASIVGPCVMRSISGRAGSLGAKRSGLPHNPEPFLVAHGQCHTAAFFDALIAQQDRHTGNYRWDPAAGTLGLIDHGFAFAVPGARCNASCFVEWRHGRGESDLTEWELAAVHALLHSHDLHGLAGVLDDEQASALAARANRMLTSATLPAVGEW